MKKLVAAAVLAAIPLTASCEGTVLARRAACVIQHESANEPDPVRAQNPRSSASGLFQFIDGTWQTMSARAGVHGYSRAMHASAMEQIYVFAYTVSTQGMSPWAGSGCS